MRKELKCLSYLLLLLTSTLSPWQQGTKECGTEICLDVAMLQRLPWYGNNQFLYDLLDSLAKEHDNKGVRTRRCNPGDTVADFTWYQNSCACLAFC